jgi:mannosyltransferase OCH1-like enzyme
MIPKNVLQTWRSNSLPVIFQKIKEVNQKTTEFQFQLWHHEEGEYNIDEFIKKEYNDLYEIYSKTQFGVQKADMIRLILLYHYGGIYIDMDILCLKSMESLIDFESNNVYLAMEPMEQTKKLYDNENVLCNAFIAGPAKHPFFKAALDEIKLIYQKLGDQIFRVFNIFGGDLLSKALTSNDDIYNSCKFVNRKLIYPINDPKFTDLSSSAEDAKMIKDGSYGNSYMVHYWIHSNFESRDILEKFKYDETQNIHINMLQFFRVLYQNNHYLQ